MRPKWGFAIGAIALALGLLAESADAEEFSLKAKRVQAPPTIDGTFEALWDQAPELTISLSGGRNLPGGSEKVAFDDSKYKPGDELPGIIIAPFTGDRGDINAQAEWKNGEWTLEFSRALTTTGEHDVQFNDLTKAYTFGVAVFDNAQVRHAFNPKPAKLTFQQR